MPSATRRRPRSRTQTRAQAQAPSPVIQPRSEESVKPFELGPMRQAVVASWRMTTDVLTIVFAAPVFRAFVMFVCLCSAFMLAYYLLSKWHSKYCAESFINIATSMGSPTCYYALHVLSGLSTQWTTLWAAGAVASVTWLAKSLTRAWIESESDSNKDKHIGTLEADETFMASKPPNAQIDSVPSDYMTSVFVDQLARWRIAEPRLLYSPQMTELQNRFNQEHETGVTQSGETLDMQLCRDRSTFLWSRQKHSELPTFVTRATNSGSNPDVEVEEIFHASALEE